MRQRWRGAGANDSCSTANPASAAPNELHRITDGLPSFGWQVEERPSDGSLSYENTKLVSAAHKWRWVGAVHEYVQRYEVDADGKSVNKDDQSLPRAPSLLSHMVHDAGGGRSGERFARDEQVLSAAVAADPRDARSWFYLGNTRRALKDADGAVHAYLQRMALGGWKEEVRRLAL